MHEPEVRDLRTVEVERLLRFLKPVRCANRDPRPTSMLKDSSPSGVGEPRFTNGLTSVSMTLRFPSDPQFRKARQALEFFQPGITSPRIAGSGQE